MPEGLYKAYVQTLRADESAIITAVSAVPEIVAADLTSPENPAIVVDDPVQFTLDPNGIGYSAYLKASDDAGWATDGPVPYIVTYRFSSDTGDCGTCPKRSWAMTMRHVLMLGGLESLPTNPVEPGWDLARLTDIPSTGVAPYPMPGPKGDPGEDGQDSDLTKAQADVLYESKSDLLKEAAWWGDAGAVNAAKTQLDDLTGRGRPAVFGAGAAAPVVLPWSGEDYLYMDGTSGNNYLTTAGSPLLIPAVATIILDFATAATGHADLVYTGASDGVGVYTDPGNLSVKAIQGGTSSVLTWAIPDRTVRHRYEIRLTATTAELLIDGATQSVKTFTVTRAPVTSQSSTSFAPSGGGFLKVWQAIIGPTHTLDPRNVSADYSTIANTGSAGGNWTITRAATGYKTAVVDRPLLLFGGAQEARVAAPGPYRKGAGHTTIMVAREVGTTKRVLPIFHGAAAAAIGQVNLIVEVGGQAQSATYNGTAWPTAAGPSIPATGPLVQSLVVTDTFSAKVGVNGVFGSPLAFGVGPEGVGPVTVGRLLADNTTAAAMSFVAAAIFDRALTDAEIAQVSQELAGTPHDKQADPHPQYVLESTVGNLFTDAQATMRAAQFGGTADLLTNPSSAVLRVTDADGDGLLSFRPIDESIVVTPGQTYTFGMKLSAASAAVVPYLVLQWLDATYAAIGSGAVGPGGSAWAVGSRYQGTAVAPANAVHARWWIQPTTAVGGWVELSELGFWRGAGGQFAMPGASITGLGYQVTHPNTDDVLAQVWDTGKGQWQRSAYHSSVRSVTITTAGTLVRVDDTVTWTGTGTPPVGFRDTWATGAKTYQTDDPIPSSLPGTLVSPAPA